MKAPHSPSRSNSKPREILMLLWSTGACGRDFLAGFSSYARNRPSWNLRLLHVREAFSQDIVRDVENGVYDGIVTDEDTFLENPFFVALTRTPLVVFGECPLALQNLPNSRLAFVQNDDAGIGAFAASHFLSLGNFRSYGFVPPNQPHSWALKRQHGFTQSLAQHQKSVFVFGDPPSSPPEKSLPSWLNKLPKPAALMVAWDNRAIEVIGACRSAGIDVPRQISIIGVDNDDLLCNFSLPSLSSILPDHRANGFLAAQALDDLFHAPPAPPHILTATGWKLIERESSAPPAPATHLIVKALEFIRQNASTNVRVNDVAKHLKISRRLLEQRFRDFQGQSVLATITDIRLEEVSRQILSTNLPIHKIASLCGFQNVSYLERIFRRKYGSTLLRWRRIHSS